MKRLIVGVVVSAIVTVPAAAQPRRGVRQVQLIAMGGMHG